MKTKFKKTYTQDKNLQVLQDNLENYFRAFDNLPQLESNIVEVIFTDTNDKSVAHGLGRPVVGWHAIDVNADTTFWQSSTVNASPSSVIILKAKAICTAKFLFF